MTYAEDIAQNVSPRSVQIMKRQIYTALGEDIKTNLKSSMEEMVKSFGSEDFKEGVNISLRSAPLNLQESNHEKCNGFIDPVIALLF